MSGIARIFIITQVRKNALRRIWCAITKPGEFL